MQGISEIVLLLSATNTFLLVTIEKWKAEEGVVYRLLDGYDIRKRSWMPQRCNWCFFLWSALLPLSYWATFNGPWWVFLLAIPCTTVSQFFYAVIRRY